MTPHVCATTLFAQLIVVWKVVIKLILPNANPCRRLFECPCGCSIQMPDLPGRCCITFLQPLLILLQGRQSYVMLVAHRTCHVGTGRSALWHCFKALSMRTLLTFAVVCAGSAWPLHSASAWALLSSCGESSAFMCFMSSALSHSQITLFFLALYLPNAPPHCSYNTHTADAPG